MTNSPITTYKRKDNSTASIELIDGDWHIVIPFHGKARFLSRERAEKALLCSGYQLVRADGTRQEIKTTKIPNPNYSGESLEEAATAVINRQKPPALLMAGKQK